MDGWQFEHEVARILNANDYENVCVTSGSGDFGVDVLAEKNRVKYAIQCKYYSEQAGVASVQQAYSGKSYYDCDRAIVIASHGFTNAAKELAIKLGVELWDANNLATMTTDEINSDSPSFEAVFHGEKIKSAPFDVPIGINSKNEVIFCNLRESGSIIVAGDMASPIDDYMHIMLLPLLYKNEANVLRLLAIDTRMLEYSQYRAVPSLLIPIITDEGKAEGALAWANLEIQKRYRLFMDARCRNLETYNEQADRIGNNRLSYVLICINDLGDIVRLDESIESIQHIQNRGISAGVFIIAYVRNPALSAGLKKLISGFNTKVCLKVSSPESSKAILDSREAYYIRENELLFFSRAQSGEYRLKTFSLDSEDMLPFLNVVEKREGFNLKDNNDALVQIEGINTNSLDNKQIAPSVDSDDSMLDEAIDIVFETKMASVSMLQQRLKLGYSRAARLVDQMEERGIVGPFAGSMPRSVLITRAEWEKRKSAGTAPKAIKYCPQCGKQNPSQAHFCAFCGSGFGV